MIELFELRPKRRLWRKLCIDFSRQTIVGMADAANPLVCEVKLGPYHDFDGAEFTRKLK